MRVSILCMLWFSFLFPSCKHPSPPAPCPGECPKPSSAPWFPHAVPYPSPHTKTPVPGPEESPEAPPMPSASPATETPATSPEASTPTSPEPISPVPSVGVSVPKPVKTLEAVPPKEPEPKVAEPPKEPEPKVAVPPKEPEPKVAVPPKEPEPKVAVPPKEPEPKVAVPPKEPEPKVAVPPKEPEPKIIIPPVIAVPPKVPEPEPAPVEPEKVCGIHTEKPMPVAGDDVKVDISECDFNFHSETAAKAGSAAAISFTKPPYECLVVTFDVTPESIVGGEGAEVDDPLVRLGVHSRLSLQWTGSDAKASWCLERPGGKPLAPCMQIEESDAATGSGVHQVRIEYTPCDIWLFEDNRLINIYETEKQDPMEMLDITAGKAGVGFAIDIKNYTTVLSGNCAQ